MKNYYILFFLSFSQVILNASNCKKIHKKEKKINQLTPRNDLEYYQYDLWNTLYDKINKEHLFNYTIGDFTSKKSNTLNFFEAAAFLLFSLTDKKYNKHIIWALERLYILSSDAKLSELLLWNLANEYEKFEKWKPASELYGQFKKIFPGSQFYWLARYKEIVDSYKYSQEEYHDISSNENIIKLIRDYIIDCDAFQESILEEIILILHDLAFKMIQKTVNIGLHYLKKYHYTYNEYTIISAWQRIETLYEDILYFEEIEIPECENNKKYKIFRATINEIKKITEKFFSIHDQQLPYGEDYELIQKKLMEYTIKNNNAIRSDAMNVYTKINYAIESYYELI